MQKGFFLSFFIFYSFLNLAQQKFVVWQGFTNSWTYNHRLNRLGDFVAQSSEGINKTATLVHAAATGIGKDSAYFTSRYAIIETNSCGFYAGKLTLNLSGKEGKLTHIRKEITLDVNTNLQQKENYIALLNGFDIVTIGSAQKLQLLKINIENPKYNSKKKTLTFFIDASINTNCTSLECDFLNRTFNYNLEVHYLILGGNSTDFISTETTYKKQLNWDTKTEMHATLFNNSIKLKTKMEAGFLAYKYISILLDKDHHYLDYRNDINSLEINSKKLEANFSMNLFYNNWKEGMKKSIASGGQATFSNKQAGWCILEGTLDFIQLKQGNIKYHQRQGCLFWIGKNKSATDKSAENSYFLKF